MPGRSTRNGGDVPEDDEEGSRKNPRRGTNAVTYTEENTPGDDPMDDDASVDENPASAEEELDDEVEMEIESVGRRRSGRTRGAKSERSNKVRAGTEDTEGSAEESRRTSSRANKFKSSMKEPSDASIKDLLEGTAISEKITKTSNTISAPDRRRRKGSSAGSEMDEDEDGDGKIAKPNRGLGASRGHRKAALEPTPHKSPARRHRQARLSISHTTQNSDHSSDESSVESTGDEREENDSNDDEDEEQQSFKIQRIIASRTEPRNVWMKICAGMNSSEIEYGSRWVQKPADDNDDTFEERFLVKWADLSYMHVSWETERDLVEQVDGAKTYLSTFFRKSEHGLLFSADERCDGDYFDPAWAQIDRILEVHFPEECPCKSVKDEDKVTNEDLGIVLNRGDSAFENGLGREFLVKWGNLPYSECTFEFERDLILNDIDYKDRLKDFHRRRKKPTKDEARRLQKEGEAEYRHLYKDIFGDKSDAKLDNGVEQYQNDLEQHVFKNGGRLRDYQAEGVSWMMANFINKRCSILADEMGLGKTIQTASFINLIATKLQRKGPFLIVAPLSTLTHWLREFEGWTDLNTIVYHGSARDRQIIRELEISHENNRPTGGVGFNQLYLRKCRPKKNNSTPGNPWMAEVIITTPELLCAEDYVELTAVDWEVLVVDEAHRLKNQTSKLAINLRDSKFNFKHTVLLTGTPIQNTMQELFALLNFISPELFDNCDEFMEKYGDMKSKENIDELHEEIRPYILRRLKEDVEKSVPPKEETLIEVELTIAQKQYYRALYEKNVKFLHKNKKKALDGPSLNNLAMQLRKCCNHLFLLNGIEEEFRSQQSNSRILLSEGDLLVKASGKLVLLDKLLPRLKENGHRILIFSQFKIMLDVLEDYLQERRFKFERIDGSITGKKRQQAIDRFQAKDVAEGREQPFIMLLSTRAGGVGINLTAADTCIIFDSDWNPQNDLQAQARCHRIGQTKNVKVYRLLTRKTYEMQMFHMSSLKMGLDQAVLKGFETGADGEGALSKDEVERLLRHGAYGIFTEDKDGSAEAESNDFVQQDIDTILDRRSRTVVHENTGTGSNAAGGTFSKARFTAPKAPESAKKASHDDVDIEDPDFWKKMVGEVQDNGENDPLVGKKRNRTVANYSEGAYHKKIDESLRCSDADDDDDDDESGDDESYGSDDGSNAGERYRWGGTKASEWKKDEVKKLLLLLQAHGYGTLAWNSLAKKLAAKNNHDDKEVQRMCWSLILLAFKEMAEEDAISTQRRAVRAAEKKRETVSDENNAAEGGVLAGNPVDNDGKPSKKLVQKCFEKLWSANKTWAGSVLEDALEFARYSQPRSEETLASVLDSDGSAVVPRPDEISLLFAQNVWPSLKSRGWKAEMQTEGSYSGKTQYSFEGKNYYSPEAVLAAAGAIHTELATVVETMLTAARTSKQKSQEQETKLKEQHLSMKTGNIDVDTLADFLRKYAPLQILYDRKSHKKLHLSRKILSACANLHTANTLVRHAEEASSNPNNVVEKLSTLLSVEKRMALPHPLWTLKHDAVLIRAIAKHGWIDNDKSCREIIADSTIKWGFPFDSEQTAKDADDTKKTSQREELIENLRATAQRAAKFFNTHHDLLEELKGFNQNLVVRSYSLVREPEERSDDSPPTWAVDDDALVASTGLSEKQEQDFVELPPKKDMVRRAKMVLSRSSAPMSGSLPQTAVVNKAMDAATDGVCGGSKSETTKYFVLDQSERCNVLLAEILRAILKAPYPKALKTMRMLCAIASEEAAKRQKAVSASFADKQEPGKVKPGEEMAQAIKQIELVKRTLQQSRQSKNLLRFMLGLEIVTAKGLATNTNNFPVERPTGKSKDKNGFANGIRIKKEDSAIGDRALSRSMNRCFEKHGGGPGRVSTEGTSQDLELTAIETLIISVICSQGLPIWTEDLSSLFYEDDGDDAADTTSEQRFTLCWGGLGNVLASAANEWHSTASRKAASCQEEYEKYANQPQESLHKSRAQRNLENAVKIEAIKKVAASQANDYAKDPPILAKKTVMLIERLRRKMGHNAGGHSKTAKKANFWLGTKLFTFLSGQLREWAKALDIVDSDGSTLAYTAADFYHDLPEEERALLDIASILNKQDCRQMLIQITALSRTRSLFMKYERSELVPKIERAARNVRVGNSWESQPSWWDCPRHDVALLESLVEWGFGGILENGNGFGPPDEDTEDFPLSLKDSGMTKNSIQQRANQLTQELHALENNVKLLHLLGTRMNRVDREPSIANGVKDTRKKQTALHSFFAKSSQKDRKINSVVELSEDESDEEAISTLNSGKDRIHNLGIDTTSASASKENIGRKRDSSDPSEDSELPEKKLRVR